MKLTISRKVVLSGLAAMITPLLIVSVYSVTSLSETVSSSNKNEMEAEATAIAELADTLFSSQKDFANGLARAPFIRKAVDLNLKNAFTADEKATASTSLQQVVKGLGNQYEAIWIADKAGQVYFNASSQSLTEYDGVNVFERPYFKKLISTQQEQLSDAVVSKQPEARSL